jgi:hypothetical protein
MFDDPVWPRRVPQTAQGAWLAYRRQRRRRILRDAVTVPLWCLDATLGGVSLSVALTAATGVYLGALFEMPLWLVCTILFVASVLPAPPDHTSQQ